MRSRLLEVQSGQGLAEYALIILFVVIVVVSILSLLGPAIGNNYSQVRNSFP